MQEQEFIIRIMQQVEQQSEEIALLKAHISALEEEIARYKHSKNSGNSSIPPSQDPFRAKRTMSLRERSGKKAGGQQGHPERTLEFSDSPDQVIDHHSHYCSVCGKDLTGLSAEIFGRCQVIDIPPIQPQITEHRIYRYRCSCGHCQESDYPAEAHSAVSYGENLTGLTAYLHSRQDAGNVQ